MAFFSKEEVVLFSPMEGVITYNGEPVEGAKLVRQVSWKDDDEVSDSVITDAKGYFEFTGITDTTSSVLPSQFVAQQRVYVYHNDQEYLMWMMGKISPELYGELDGKPTNLRCELTEELRRVEGPYSGLGTICHWDSIE